MSSCSLAAFCRRCPASSVSRGECPARSPSQQLPVVSGSPTAAAGIAISARAEIVRACAQERADGRSRAGMDRPRRIARRGDASATAHRRYVARICAESREMANVPRGTLRLRIADLGFDVGVCSTWNNGTGGDLADLRSLIVPRGTWTIRQSRIRSGATPDCAVGPRLFRRSDFCRFTSPRWYNAVWIGSSVGTCLLGVE